MTTTNSIRVRLESGTTIADVYRAFCESVYGAEDPARSRDELRDVIQTLEVRYQDCDSVTVLLDWANGQTDDASPEFDPTDEAE